KGNLLWIVAKCLHKALDNPDGSSEALCLNFFIQLLGFMHPVLPPVQDIGGVRIKDTATPELARIGGCRSPFEPMAYCLFRHPHPLCHLSLRQSLCAQSRHLLIAIITTGLTCLMDFLHVSRSALLPCGCRGKRASGLFSCLLQLRQSSLSLANFRTTVPKDLLEHL